MTSDTTTEILTNAQQQLDCALGKTKIALSGLSNTELVAFADEALAQVELKHLRGFTQLKDTVVKNGFFRQSPKLSDDLQFQSDDEGITLETQSIWIPRRIYRDGPVSVSEQFTYGNLWTEEETSNWSVVEEWYKRCRQWCHYQKRGTTVSLQLFRTRSKNTTADSNLFLVMLDFSTAAPKIDRYKEVRGEGKIQGASIPHPVITSIGVTKVPITMEMFAFLGDNTVKTLTDVLSGISLIYSNTHHELSEQEEKIGEMAREFSRITDVIC